MAAFFSRLDGRVQRRLCCRRPWQPRSPAPEDRAFLLAHRIGKILPIRFKLRHLISAFRVAVSPLSRIYASARRRATELEIQMGDAYHPARIKKTQHFRYRASVYRPSMACAISALYDNTFPYTAHQRAFATQGCERVTTPHCYLRHRMRNKYEILA